MVGLNNIKEIYSSIFSWIFCKWNMMAPIVTQLMANIMEPRHVISNNMCRHRRTCAASFYS